MLGNGNEYAKMPFSSLSYLSSAERRGRRKEISSSSLARRAATPDGQQEINSRLMQSLVSIANLRSRGFSRFSLGRSIPAPPDHSSIRPSTRHLNCAPTFLFFHVLRKFLGLRAGSTSASDFKKVQPCLSVQSRSRFHSSCETFPFLQLQHYKMFFDRRITKIILH